MGKAAVELTSSIICRNISPNLSTTGSLWDNTGRASLLLFLNRKSSSLYSVLFSGRIAPGDETKECCN